MQRKPNDRRNQGDRRNQNNKSNFRNKPFDPHSWISRASHSDYLTEELDNEQVKIDNGANQDYFPQNIITPFNPNGSQRKFLSTLFGKHNVDLMSETIMMGQMGLIDNKCPSLSNPEKTYKQIDPYTGNYYCTDEPLKTNDKRISTTSRDKTTVKCDVTEEAYLSEGTYQCFPKILRGKFHCPTDGHPENGKLVVLNDGTGICIPSNSYYDDGGLLGISLGNDEIDEEKFDKYLKLYKTMKLNKFKKINQLNGLFKMYDLSTLKERLHEQRLTKILGDKINSPNDLQTANAALYLYAKKLNIIPKTFNKWNSFFTFNKNSPITMLTTTGAGMIGGASKLGKKMSSHKRLNQDIKKIRDYNLIREEL